MLLLLFRVVFLTLYTLFTTLISPRLVIGGKYHVLFFATVAAYLIRILRFGGRCLPERERGLVSALGVIAGLLLVGWLFDGVKMGLAGILLLYLGVFFMEMLLSEEQGLFSKKDHFHNEA